MEILWVVILKIFNFLKINEDIILFQVTFQTTSYFGEWRGGTGYDIIFFKTKYLFFILR